MYIYSTAVITIIAATAAIIYYMYFEMRNALFRYSWGIG